MNEINIATDLLKKIFVVSKGRLITHTNEEYDAVMTEIGAYLYDIAFLDSDPAITIKEFIVNPIGFNKAELAALIGIDILGDKIKGGQL